MAWLRMAYLLVQNLFRNRGELALENLALRVMSKNSIDLQTEPLRCNGCHANRFSAKAGHNLPASALSFASLAVDDVVYAARR